MPVSRRAGMVAGSVYSRPFVGAIHDTAQMKLNITALDNTVVDSDGYLKPGVPFRRSAAGTIALVSAPAQAVYGVSIEPIKVAEGNDAPSLAAAAANFELGVATLCQVNRKAAEDNLGRVYSADELAAFVAAGSRVQLLH